MSWKIIVCIVLVIIAAAAGFYADKISNLPNIIKLIKMPKVEQDTSAKALSAIKTYAAFQFGVEEASVKITTSSKHHWDDICLGIDIPNYDCKKSNISGYEATVDAGGYLTKYRANDDGSIIRVVK